MQHWVLWCDRQLDMPVIWQHIEAKFPSAEYDSLMFVNPPSLQSITAVSVATLSQQLHGIFCTA